jgi:hypothetical protein
MRNGLYCLPGVPERHIQEIDTKIAAARKELQELPR